MVRKSELHGSWIGGWKLAAKVSGKTLISAPLSKITENSEDLTVTMMRGADPAIIREGIIIIDGSSV